MQDILIRAGSFVAIIVLGWALRKAGFFAEDDFKVLAKIVINITLPAALISSFAGKQIDKILTIEASGIGIACVVARHFGDVPVVFAKKAQSINLDGDQYVTKVYSFTKQREFPVIVSKRFLKDGEHVLIIDDFLANGCALQGLISIAESAGAKVEGCGIVIEKGFQIGGRVIRNMGYHVESLAIVDAMDSENGTITFREQGGK